MPIRGESPGGNLALGVSAWGMAIRRLSWIARPFEMPTVGRAFLR